MGHAGSWRALALLLVATCSIATFAATRTRAETSGGYRFGAGDVLEIEYLANSKRQEQFTVTVAASGMIGCPLLGDLKAGGRNAEELVADMQERLSRDFFVDPQVLLRVRDYGGKVFVGGEVRQPGAYGLQQGLTALDACLLAGGFTDFASLHHVKVFRMTPAGVRPLEIDLVKVRSGKTHDVPLQLGDRVDVPRRRF
jgi:polysaccharide export outer membrane protein